MTIPKSTLLSRWNDIIKRFLVIFLPLALFFGSLTVLFYYRDVTSEKLAVEQSERYKVNSQIKTVRSRFEAISSDLQFLAHQKVLATYLQSRDPAHLSALAEDLVIFRQSKSIYDTIQFIDEKGRELVVAGTQNKTPLIAPDPMLRDKAEHTYFLATMKLRPNRVYISPFGGGNDSTIDEAHSPVIRFSMPVLNNNGERSGIIVLTHPITRLIEDLQTTSTSSPGLTILATPNGNYLNSFNEDPHLVDAVNTSSSTIENLLSAEWQEIQKAEQGQFTSPMGLITFNTVYPYQAATTTLEDDHTASKEQVHDLYLWKNISFVPQKVLAKWPEKILGRILLLYSVCLFILAISSFMLARTSVRRRRAEKAMRENEEELRAINEAAANAIIAIDSQKNILHWNPAAERLFQYNATEVVEKPITSIIAPPKHQSTFTKISKKFKLPEDSDGMAAKTIELYGYKKDGTEFPVEVSFSAFKKGDQWHTVGIIRDISARKLMEKEVLRAHKFESLGVLSSGIAHDFNNLLTAIIGNINLVSRLSGTPPDSRDLLKNAEKAAHRAKALTQQLLTFSKEGMPIRKTTAVENLIRDSVEYALHGSPVSSSFDIAEDLLLVDIDAGQIGQVIQNIITNSRQAIRG
ncbi:MAG: PAS domain S-box protein, partial [Desulfopila sp.]|nr:PAS domain S-box protein [Desulfopila sp.]